MGKLCNEHSHIPRNFVIFSWTSNFFLITNTKFYWITVQRFSTLEFYINSSGWPRLQCTKRFASSKCMGILFPAFGCNRFLIFEVKYLKRREILCQEVMKTINSFLTNEMKVQLRCLFLLCAFWGPAEKQWKYLYTW